MSPPVKFHCLRNIVARKCHICQSNHDVTRPGFKQFAYRMSLMYPGSHLVYTFMFVFYEESLA